MSVTEQQYYLAPKEGPYFEDLKNVAEENGGYARITGVVSVQVGFTFNQVPRYRIHYPSGKTDYVKVGDFNDYFTFVLHEAPARSANEIDFERHRS